MKHRQVIVECIHCKKKSVIHYYGSLPVVETLRKRRIEGWIVNFKRPKRSTCPRCNMFFHDGGEPKKLNEIELEEPNSSI